MKVINDVLGYKNLKIYQDTEFFKFSLDSVMLANFVTINLRNRKILDLGCGNGIIPLILSRRTKADIVGVEIQKSVSSLASKSVIYNNLEKQISIINQDMKEYFKNIESDTFDVITCNPPYFELHSNSCVNKISEKMLARHEVTITLHDVFMIARKLLKNGGNFAIVHRPERLLEILDLFRNFHLEPKRIQFVYEKLTKSPILVLIEGSKSGKPGLKIERPFVLYDESGSKSLEYEQFIKEGVK